LLSAALWARPALRASMLPASKAAEACNYALGNWGLAPRAPFTEGLT
jgi:hypothetical protein